MSAHARPLQQRLEDLADAHAADGDVRSAVLATWAAQMERLDQMLCHTELGGAAAPQGDLAATGEALARAIEAAVETLTEPISAHDLVTVALDAAGAALEPAQAAELSLGAGSSLPRLQRLVPSTGRRAATAAERLEERTAEELVVELLATAADCMAVAHELVAEDEHAAAARMARQADVATFEAYLVAAASLGGDLDLASVQVRWDLAREHAGATGPAHAAHDVSARVAEHRRALVGLLGTGEQPVLQQTFEPAP